MRDKAFPGAMTAADARFEAQRIAFAPIVFQVVRVLRSRGLLRELVARRDWVDQADLEKVSGLSRYAVTVLLESALSAGIVEREAAADDVGAPRWRAGAVGRVIERDPLVGINMDFVADVCYRSMDHLGEALQEGVPAGLPELGSWPTFYEGMSQVPEPARSSWFSFDHHYSDHAFPHAMEILAQRGIHHIADVGANTGRFATAFLTRFPSARITLCDLPQQLVMARANLLQQGLLDRATLHPCDLLDPASRLPEGDAAPDAFWMSQFVCCFSEEQVVAILRRAAQALGAGRSVFVMDTFWDDQQHAAAAYCLINTSPYFAAVANGNSRMYRLDVFLSLAGRAGLSARGTWHNVGLCHTLVELG